MKTVYVIGSIAFYAISIVAFFNGKTEVALASLLFANLYDIKLKLED